MKQNVKSLTYIVLGNMLIAFAICTLVLENNFIAGGVTGIGRIINHFTSISIPTVVLIVNTILFLLGLIFVGKRFTMSTLVSTFLFPIFLDIFQRQSLLQHYCSNVLLASIIAGCLIGLGIGLVIKANASTGGTDIIAIIVNKKFNVSVSVTLYCMDLCILVLQIFFSDLTKVLYGFITILLTSFVLNRTLNFGKSMGFGKSVDNPSI